MVQGPRSVCMDTHVHRDCTAMHFVTGSACWCVSMVLICMCRFLQRPRQSGIPSHPENSTWPDFADARRGSYDPMIQLLGVPISNPPGLAQLGLVLSPTAQQVRNPGSLKATKACFPQSGRSHRNTGQEYHDHDASTCICLGFYGFYVCGLLLLQLCSSAMPQYPSSILTEFHFFPWS